MQPIILDAHGLAQNREQRASQSQVQLKSNATSLKGSFLNLAEEIRTHGCRLRNFADRNILGEISDFYSELRHRGNLELLNHCDRKFPNPQGNRWAAGRLIKYLSECLDREREWKRGEAIDVSAIPCQVRVFMRWVVQRDPERSKTESLSFERLYLVERVFSRERPRDVQLVRRAIELFVNSNSEFCASTGSGQVPFSNEVRDKFTGFVRRQGQAEGFLLDVPDSPEQFVLEALDGANRFALGECHLPEGKEKSSAKTPPENKLKVSSGASSKALFAECKKWFEEGNSGSRSSEKACELFGEAADAYVAFGLAHPEALPEISKKVRAFLAEEGRISITVEVAKKSLALKDPLAIPILCDHLNASRGAAVRHKEKLQLGDIAVTLANKTSHYKSELRKALIKWSAPFERCNDCDKVRMHEQAADICKLRMRLALGASYTEAVASQLSSLSNRLQRNRILMPVFSELASEIELQGDKFQIETLPQFGRQLAQSHVGEEITLKW